MLRGGAFVAGLFLGLLPAMGQAQTNIDQGKSPAEIFATDCATCHKSARGLANGRGSSGLASFLVEHYTASKDQAAALAAYVMGAGGGEPAPRGPKPASAPVPDRNRASAEPAVPPTRTPGKPEQAPPAAGRSGPQPATASRNRRNEPPPTPPMQQPAAVVAEPAPSSPPAQESPAAVPGPSAAAPANADPGENTPVPRDNIPD